MNRLWAQFFGVGLSKNLYDLGTQGEIPSKSELLDWLAVEFMESGWDIKHMVELIVSSQAYKRSSHRVVEAKDPENRELTRQNRLRLPAELIRDNALFLSGLLDHRVGGPSVKPYQPEHHWDILDQPRRTYIPDKATDQYRRGLYIWKQRTALHPFLFAFDAASGEECIAERARSNIPQHALNLLNDPCFIEAARAFASRILEESSDPMEKRIEWAWKHALARAPRYDELKRTSDLYKASLSEFKSKPSDTHAFLSIGYFHPKTEVAPAELAAWTSVARMILNLHESITRP
jgi:hypothetical protein